MPPFWQADSFSFVFRNNFPTFHGSLHYTLCFSSGNEQASSISLNEQLKLKRNALQLDRNRTLPTVYKNYLTWSMWNTVRYDWSCLGCWPADPGRYLNHLIQSNLMCCTSSHTQSARNNRKISIKDLDNHLILSNLWAWLVTITMNDFVTMERISYKQFNNLIFICAGCRQPADSPTTVRQVQ